MTDLELTQTRLALHVVAEVLLAGPQYRCSGLIDLRVSPGGFRTRADPALSVVSTDVVSDGAAFPIPGRSARTLAASLNVTAGAPLDVYPDLGADLDEPLFIDGAAAAHLANALAQGDKALRLLAPGIKPVLWPEHFDVGIRVGDVNYGVSPGDGYCSVPYAYIGVTPLSEQDEFWNAPFGHAQPMTDFADAAELRDFFAQGGRYPRQPHARG